MHPSTTPSPDASFPGIAHYTFLRQLGQGRFCVVHLGRHFYTQKLYAVKVIDKQAHKPDILHRLRREIELMESLDHPNIVKLHEVIETQFSIYVCMEYVEGCSLEQLLKNQLLGRLCESDARSITRELASAVSHCHSRFVVHRDLKPANVLITPGGKVMLIDFGLGNTFSYRSRLNTICGSLPYYSPEIARGSNYTGPEVDIWCLGVTLFRMVVGHDPFIGNTKRDVKAMITQGTFRLPSNLSNPLQATLLKLLAPESCKRRNLGILEGDPWLHGDSMEQLPPFLSEDRGMGENSRLSGTTLIRHSSKHIWKRHSQTESYYYGKNGSLLGSRSLLADMTGGGIWQLDKAQPRFHKNRIRLLPSPGAESDQLFRKDIDLSLLQFLMPILWNCRVSYYLHSTSRILCGTSFDRDSSISKNQAAIVLSKFVHHLGAVMTGSLTVSPTHTPGTSMARSGVFSIDIVKERGSDKSGYLLIVKRLFGSSSTVQHFKKQFLQNAASRDDVGATFI
ncbi:hypothetical protein EMPS_04391 [Entomortierella parvispora]|uniref:Protein kinase domain-containing protein n=1 Tax=Entomortierella parvispora TaxID=205924 RepID=A0A9P3H8H8_9FUNG|nr:hypothetical protein EMPS_04391 [Entomortierella parvispora]